MIHPLKTFPGKVITGFIVLFMIVACSSQSSSTEAPAGAPAPSSTDSPTQTPVSTPTQDLPPVQEFTLENADNVSPENLFEEVAYELAGGGGGEGECPYYDPNSPTIGYISNGSIAPKLEPIVLFVCGWEPEEEIHVKIITPDGKEQEQIITASRPFMNYATGDTGPFAVLDYEFTPLPDQFGEYQFIFSGISGVIKQKIRVPSPNLSMILQNDSSGDSLLYIQGLMPAEKVQIALYNRETSPGWITYHFYASIEFISDEDGELLVRLEEEPVHIIAVGNVSGVIPYTGGMGPNVQKANSDGSCAANLSEKNFALPTRLEVGDYAYVATDPPLSNRVRSGPGKDNKLINTIKPGTVIKIIDGPKCIDRANWWKIAGINSKLEGWTLEGEEEYWLVPCSPKNKACP